MAEPQNTITIKFKPEGDKGLVSAIKALDNATKKLINTQGKLVEEGRKQITQAQRNEKSLQTMNVRLKALDSSFTKAGISSDLMNKALSGNRVALEQVRIAVKKHIQTLDEASARTRILGGTFAVLRSQMLLFQFGMSLGIRQLIRFTSEAAKVESMERAFNTLSGGGNQATEALIKLKEATNNTMSSFDLFQQANNAMVLGVTKNSDEMAEMFDIAQRLGNALGRDTAQSVESLVTGIGRQSRLMLDNIGIMVRSGEAYENYARKLGKNADDLTDLEKKQAFANATMKQARLLARLLAPEVENAQMSFNQLGAASSELAMELGQALQPSLKLIADITKSLAESVDADDFRRLGRAVVSLATAYGTYRTAVFLATLETNKFTAALLKNPVGAVAVGLSTLLFVLLEYANSTKKTTELTKEQKDETKKLTEEQRKLKAELKEIINSQETVNDVIERNNKFRDEQVEKINSSTKALYEELVAIKLQNFALQGASKSQVRLLKETADGNKKGGAAKKGLLDLILREIELNDLLQQAEKIREKIAKDSAEERKNAFDNLFKAGVERDKAYSEISKKLSGDTEQYKINQAELARDKYIAMGVDKQVAEEFYNHEIQRITKETEEKKRKEAEKTQKALDEIRNKNEEIVKHQASLQEELHKNNVEFQLLQIDLREQELQQIATTEEQKIALIEHMEQRKKDAVIRNLEETDELYNAFMGGYETFVNTMIDLDMSLDDKKKALMESMKRATLKFIADLLVEQLKSVIARQVIEKKAQAASIVSAKATGAALALAYSVPASYASTASFGGAAVAGLAASQASVAAHKATAAFEDGGLVGGKRHSEGGTIIEAERGEFVMSRSAVEAIGIETLNQLNQGKGTGVTVNISAPLVDETVVDAIIPAIERAKRMDLA